MAIKIGITGGIGSGKSVVSHLLMLMGIPVYISDIEAKRLMLTNENIQTDLCNLLGEDVYQGGQLNKALLTSYLFADSENAKKVNAIVHPRVRDDFRIWTQAREPINFVGIESAILYEAGFENEVDLVVMVYAPIEVRIERAIRRDAASRKQVEERVHSQMEDEDKIRLADYILINDGKRPLIPQVLGLISSLSQNH